MDPDERADALVAGLAPIDEEMAWLDQLALVHRKLGELEDAQQWGPGELDTEGFDADGIWQGWDMRWRGLGTLQDEQT